MQQTELMYKLGGQRAMLGEHHFIFLCVLDNLAVCMLTEEDTAQQQQKVMLTQLSLTNFK